MTIPSNDPFKDEYDSLEKVEGKIDNACPMIQVVAPANLPGGYIFEVDLDGQPCVVIVVRNVANSSVCALCWL